MKEIEYRKSLILGFLFWLFALIYSMFIFLLIGIDITDPNITFGPDHPKYLLFELFMLPGIIAIGFIVLSKYFKDLDKENYKAVGIKVGIIVMVLQFILDTLLFVILLDIGFQYFIALVTVGYITIPGWSLLIARYWATR